MQWFTIISTLLGASTFGSVFEVGAVSTLRKCCPKDQSLIKVAENISNVQYECVDGESARENYNIKHFSLLMVNNLAVEYGFPENCDSDNFSTEIVTEVDISNENSTCYDKLLSEIENGTVVRNIPKTVSLKCRSETNEHYFESKLKVNLLRKCCPKGKVYDVQYHLCRDDDGAEFAYDNWLRLVFEISGGNSYLYDVEHDLNCKNDEYSVELSEINFALQIDGSSLKYSGKKGNGIIYQEEWCIDRMFDSKNLVAKVCTKDCASYGAFCFRKCCRLGEHYKPFRCSSYVSACVPTTEAEMFFNISSYLDPSRNGDVDDLLDVQGVRVSLKCPKGKFAFNHSDPVDNNWLQRDGRLASRVPTLDPGSYCIELFDWRTCPYKSPIEVTALSCFTDSPLKKNFFLSAVTMSISAVCLAITLVIYCALPELRNLHGKTIICHVSTMMLAYACLARAQFQKVDSPNLCKALGYGIYFGFVSAFVWLNVMCYDIWSTFGSMRSVQPLRKASAERRRFAWYSVYAWSLVLLLTLVMYLLDTFPVANFLKANMGVGICWFGTEQNSKSDWPHYVFFVIPMGVLTFLNLVLWLLTVRHCVRVKSEVHRLQAGSVGDRAKKSFRVNRANFILTGKLWVVMGAGWFAELLSTLFTEPPWLWTAVDLVSQLQGLIVFLILVLKPKIYYLIRKRLGLEKPDAQKNGASSGRTSTTFLSRTISSDERTHMRISLPSNDVKRA